MRVVTAQTGKETLDVDEAKEAAYPEQIVRNLRDADAMLNAGKDLAAVLQTLDEEKV